MTSGTFKSVEVSSIWVDRAKRQRQELEGIEELAESIQRAGLIHPPVIRHSGELVVGERRLAAIKLLGWTHCAIQYIEDLPDDELQVVELEENIRRKDISWQDYCRSVDTYHELRATTDKDWNQTKTAEALGITASEVAHKRSVARELKAGNEAVAAAPKYSTARGIVQRNTERKLASVAPSDEPQVEVPLLLADFHDWVVTYDGEPFNLIHCDFPYGINADKHDQGAAPSFGGYKDTAEIYWGLLGSLLTAVNRGIVAESAHLIFWFSMDYYCETMTKLSQMGWRVNPFPLIWHKSDGTSILPDASRGPRRSYETAFFASRGDRKIVRATSNLCPCPVTKTVHMSEKPMAMLKHFLEMICDDYSTVLDPTCGSGNALRAARALDASRVLGLERDSEILARATEAWRQAETGNEANG